MKMKVDRKELAKLGMFLSALMIFFGFGNYYAAADLFASTRFALVWLLVGALGVPILAYSIVQFRKSEAR